MAGQQPGAGQEGGDKNTYYILWVIALIGFVGFIVWYFFGEPLKQAFLFIKVYELMAISFVLDLTTQIPGIGKSIQSVAETVGAELALAKRVTPSTITLSIAELLSVATGEMLRYPVGIYLIFISYFVYKSSVQARLKRKFNMKTLAAQEQVVWPQIKVATKHDILDQDLDNGPWAMAMSPVQFCKKNKLVSIEVAPQAGSDFLKAKSPGFTVVVDRARTERAFSVQLGRSFQGVEQMPPHRRALFAVFAARGCRDSKAAQSLVKQLAISGAEGKLNFEGVNELLKKHVKNKAVKEICERHAYEFTLFISLLLFAREDGVVPSSEFLWVKPLDRRLWYVINNVGRQTPSVEVGGIFCHWYHEMALKRPLSCPKVQAAVTAVELALTEVIYIPDDQEKEEIQKRQAESEHVSPEESHKVSEEIK